MNAEVTRAQVTLTPAESKRLIAKGVANMNVIKNALKNGIICIARGTTNAFILEELLGMKVEKGRFAMGIVTPLGMCLSAETLHEVAIEKGEIQRGMHICAELIPEMGRDDVLIKGANALDPQGNAAVFYGDPKGGGKLGNAILIAMTKGVHLIIPVGLEKLIPTPVGVASRETGTNRIDYSMGRPIGLTPVFGTVVTELEAINILTGAAAIQIGAGGIGGAEGSVTLIIKGDEERVRKAVEIIEKCKGEEAIKPIQSDCLNCEAPAGHPCPNRKKQTGRYISSLPRQKID